MLRQSTHYATMSPLLLALSTAAGALALPKSALNQFHAGQKASATLVNQNFEVLRQAVNANHQRIAGSSSIPNPDILNGDTPGRDTGTLAGAQTRAGI